MLDVILKRFDQPDETRTFSKGKFDLVHRLGATTIGRATYEPGWRWSQHVGAGAEDRRPAGALALGDLRRRRRADGADDGREIAMRAGDVFYIAPGHDSWVVGDEPYVSLHFMGAADYAKHD